MKYFVCISYVRSSGEVFHLVRISEAVCRRIEITKTLGGKHFIPPPFEYLIQRDSWNFSIRGASGSPWKFRELIKKIKTKGIYFYYREKREREGILFKFQLLLLDW